VNGGGGGGSPIKIKVNWDRRRVPPPAGVEIMINRGSGGLPHLLVSKSRGTGMAEGFLHLLVLRSR
jgi:hypothetical protein